MPKLNSFGLGIAVIVFVIYVLVANAQAAVIYVPDDYPTIQQAVDASNRGDTIIVRGGTYIENVYIDKPYLTIRSENGSTNCIVQAADSSNPVIEVTASFVSVTGFTVGKGSVGIYLNHTSYCNISKNNCSNNGYGIRLWYSNNSNIINNICSKNSHSIDLIVSNDNVISSNICKNSCFNIYLSNSNNNKIKYNNCSNTNIQDCLRCQPYYGISLSCSNNNIITNNKIFDNIYGIFFIESSYNKIISNEIFRNAKGLRTAWKSKFNEISRNAFFDNSIGLYLHDVCYMVCPVRNNNIIYFNNFINNTNNARTRASENIWRSTEPMTYTYNGKTYKSYLGNYWDDYIGSDADGDGIGDTPYSIDSDKDNYPLMEPWENYFAWSFDSDFQYNLDDNYGTVEGDGHLSGEVTLSALNLSIEGQITFNGEIPSQFPEIYLIATGGEDKEFAKQYVNFSDIRYEQINSSTYNFTVQIRDAIQPINGGHYEISALITYNSEQYYFFVNTKSLINSSYFPLWIPIPPENLPPNPPLNLRQLKSDGVTEIPEGGTINESTVIFKGTVSDPDGNDVRLEIELRRVEEPFVGEPTLETNFEPSGSEVTITRNGLVTGNYKWRCRVKDSKGAISEWKEFGVAEKDFTVWAEKGLEVDIEPEAPEGYYINKSINLTVTVTNPTNRTGVNISAYNVSLTLIEPDEIDFEKTFATVGDIAPGESKIAYFNGTMKKVGDNVEVIVNAEGDADLRKIRGVREHPITIHNPKAPKPNWSFAIITDLHIGFNSSKWDPDNDGWYEIDYGTAGWNDRLRGEKYEKYYITQRLRNAIDKIIAEKDERNIKFVVVLGDISDTAERSEFLKARERLNKLNDPNGDGNTSDGIPYIILIGNHDTWPYTQDLGKHSYWPRDQGTDNSDVRKYYANISNFASGDRFFKEVFWENNDKNKELINKLFGKYWKSTSNEKVSMGWPTIYGPEGVAVIGSGAEYSFTEIERGGNKFKSLNEKTLISYEQNYYLQNYGFVYDNITFITLDLAPRLGEDPDPFNGDALPGDFKGAMATDHPQTLDFARRYFKEHPNDKVILFSHYPTKRGSIDNYISERGKNLPIAAYWFGGHVHYNKEAKYERERRKRYVILTEDVAGIPFKFLGIPAEIGRGVRDGKIIRIVSVKDGEIDFSLRLKPPEPKIEWSWENALSTVPIIISYSYPEPNNETIFTAEYTPYYGFNTTFNWDFGDRNRASGFYVTHNYSQEGEYNVTLTINVTNLITGETRNNTIIGSVYVHSKHVISSPPSDLNITSLMTGEDLTQIPKNEYVPALISKNASEKISIGHIGIHFEEADEDINLSTLIADINLTERKSVIYMPSWPAEIETFKSLFIPSTGSGAVYVCKNATSLEEVSQENADFVINVGETKEGMTLSTVFYNGGEYYKLSGVTGTGGGEASSQHPYASFTYSPEYPIVNEKIIFNASSSYDPDGNITKYKWDFGDGNITEVEEPIITHTYSISGNYTVKLTVTDDKGMKSSIYRNITVRPVINQPPIANANGPYTGIEGQHVEFNASLSYDPEGVPLTYYWEFGDGETAVATQPTTSHVYAQQGNYTVTLIVNDSVQNSTPSITYALINDTEPKANFTANKTSGFAPLTVQFNDSSVSYDGIVKWEWDFDGDGVTDSNEQNPIYTYDEAGTYTVSLTVYEADGDSDTETKEDYITVTSAADTEPPTIESVTLDTYINIPNSSFHVTVEATDNVGVTSVTADGVTLTKTGSTWEGDIFIPEGTPEGEYTLTIIAQDEAGNTAESSVNYSVVLPQGGFAVAIDPMMSSASGGDVKVYQIKIISNENFDDKLHVYISDEGIPDAYKADFEFNWTDKKIYLKSGDTVELSLEVTIPSASGYKMFRAYADSKRFRTSGYCTGIVLIS